MQFYMVVFFAFSVIGSPVLVHDSDITAESMRLPWPVSPLEVRPNTFNMAMIQQQIPQTPFIIWVTADVLHSGPEL